MRKAQKRQIEETISLMEEVHNEMKRCIEKGAIAQVEKLLADCQNAAVAIGTLIEKTEGQGHHIITVLEEYCELVYQIHEYLLSDSGVNANKVYKSLRQKLFKAQNSIKNDIKVRTEAIFLPYKASMWDSLESVWKAAHVDPDCDAYVIPIPYFDKNPDGSFGEEHYEGDRYPAYVPVTRYDEYNMESRRPDVIYIHNPYDECNYVTSVHPYFYSKNLKNFTDMLIYIPYFVLGEIDPDNQASIDNISHFCFAPGTIYANRVIVQSENMRQIYINEYLKAAKGVGLGGGHVDRKFLEKKFLGTGSPKIDKVLHTKKEDLEVSSEWLKVIEKPDGSWKRIIFYNTGVGALLQYGEKMLRKMKSVFEAFEENKEKAALLWRPHPLIEATVKSMRPQLWEPYEKIKNRYIEEGWGIYDDTSDVDRAVVLSDAYYGDRSSVMELCQKAGKPVMLANINRDVFAQNKEIRDSEKDDKKQILANDMAAVGKDYYFFSLNYNGLYCLHMPERQVEFLGSVPWEKFQKRYLYGSMIEVDGKLYMPPMNGEEIAVYDLKQRKFEKIALRCECNAMSFT